LDIFFITLCGVISGADGWVAISEYGKAKEEWFKEVLGLENGIPSHDTLGNVFGMIDIEQFERCFISWVNDLQELSEGEVISLDGKCLRGSKDEDKSAIYMVSAWASENKLVLGQQKVDEKSNEITAIPKLLEQLDIAGSVVTMDAMGCQTAITEQIVEKSADYVLSLKGNQGSLHQDVKLFFDSEKTCPEVAYESFDAEHGRYETRTIRVSSDIDWLRQLHPHWTALNSIIAVTSTREIKDKTSQETRYFISSLGANNPQRLAHIIRAHWGIENNLHWILDTAFDEDAQRQRKNNSAANLSIVRHIALNLLKAEKSAKLGIKNKRLKAAWNNHYLLKVLNF